FRCRSAQYQAEGYRQQVDSVPEKYSCKVNRSALPNHQLPATTLTAQPGCRDQPNCLINERPAAPPGRLAWHGEWIDLHRPGRYSDDRRSMHHTRMVYATGAI